MSEHVRVLAREQGWVLRGGHWQHAELGSLWRASWKRDSEWQHRYPDGTEGGIYRTLTEAVRELARDEFRQEMIDRIREGTQ
jgi:hypothetical protein